MGYDLWGLSYWSSFSALVYVAPSINVCEWIYKESYGKSGHIGRQSPKS